MFKFLLLFTTFTTNIFCKPILLNDNELIVHFTPEDNPEIPLTTNHIVSMIESAKEEILVQAYTLTSEKIINALIEQHQKGVKVIIIIDKCVSSQTLTNLKNKKINVHIDILRRGGIAHNKVMIIDNSIVLTGSFNFTKAAQDRNTENSLTIKNKKVAKKYKENFNKRLIKSKISNIVDMIKNAKNEILIQAHNLTPKSIINALIEKHKEKIKVIIIVDNNHVNSETLTELKNEGVVIYTDKLEEEINHNEFMTIDERIVLNDSFNFIASAKYRNAENSFIIEDEKTAKQYKDNFNKRLNKSKNTNTCSNTNTNASTSANTIKMTTPNSEEIPKKKKKIYS